MKPSSLALDKLITSLCCGAIAYGGGIAPSTPIWLPFVTHLFLNDYIIIITTLILAWCICHNLSLRLTTKTRVYKGAGQD
jgi:hypothetical protein